MTELKFYLLCFMIAVPQGALGSASEEFVEKSLHGATYFMISKTIEYLSTEDPEECFSEAINRDAQAVRFGSDDCYFHFLSGSVCTEWEGDFKVYVRKDFLANGSPIDGAQAYVDYYKESLPAIRLYRIGTPTILDFGDIQEKNAPLEEVFQYFATSLNGFTFVYSAQPSFVDPSCYTTSPCSYVFLTTAPVIPESEILILYDICGQNIQVDSGKSLYVLSHESIGCKNFPNDYPVDDCWAEFIGAGEITINVTLVNFRESDQCDGFTMTAETYDANGSSSSTDLCDATAPTELTSEGGKVRIDFGGSASPTREKYGFDIQVTAA